MVIVTTSFDSLNFGLFFVLGVYKIVIFCRDSLCPHLPLVPSDHLIYCMFLYSFCCSHTMMRCAGHFHCLYDVLLSTKSS